MTRVRLKIMHNLRVTTLIFIRRTRVQKRLAGRLFVTLLPFVQRATANAMEGVVKNGRARTLYA